MREKLRAYFENRSWAGGRGKSPRSGPGSSLESTAALRAALPRIFAQYSVKTFFDAPCGDWFWMQTVDLSGIDYIGADISKGLVDQNTASFGKDGVRFLHLDITSDPLPPSDLLLCRDCLFHLKFWLRWQFFENFANSQSRYLMLTMHHVAENQRLNGNGGFKPFNPMAEPFNLPEPLEQIAEQAGPEPRSLAIWTREQVAEAVANRRHEADAEAGGQS
jgi:SAM-dependent methyltransferase